MLTKPDGSVTHFNHAGAGLPTAATLQAITDHLDREVLMGPMEAEASVAGRLADGYRVAGQLLGCRSDEIAFGTGHGQLYGNLIAAMPIKQGDRILVSRQEWVGNLIALRRKAEACGATIEVMPNDVATAVDVEATRRILDDDVKLVAMTWVGASCALINPAARLGDILKGTSAAFVIDASQAIGQIPIDVDVIGCDALVACGRKYLRGPRGTALAFISRHLSRKLEPSSADDHSAMLQGERHRLHDGARALEFGEYPVALRLGLIQAMDEALLANIADTRIRLNEVASALRQSLAEIPGVSILDLGAEMAAFVTFVINGVQCDRAKELLASCGITIGKNGKGYTPIDLPHRGIDEVLRASVHLSTDEKAIGLLVLAIAEIASSQNKFLPGKLA
ncbi:aminotransferase class V-fold PLP-dependent enzyme [Mesorhizobium qingshengii]|uniref:Selenocysteine lyase/Cysteine desulfurase n=1 Tax=Mesorhizobium qingshengii TaxID=1165689 RepID=A0A1G5ZAM7_9HYPH|nr:aminotransferase class V-fold PLP-dependent enzyme [Mesorhizobium qingshengii]SDA91626.1 Selenocysteine lyase/Cysteine desulfurase [Mesorhizobium qingshengii]